MKYVIQVKGPAYGQQRAYLAYQFATTLLKSSEHSITQIFFYQEGVLNANEYVYPANDEFNLVEAWKNLAQHYQVELNVCVSAAQRRGVVDEASSHGKDNNLATGFILAGLAEFSQAILKSDRVVSF